ncbi:uncharacterized protein LOC143284557 [Babylonia areolata]|uniref:uncharacterized protein LOC143284557 n=1 Tax=Babylonia areolata TaxID=304850 RepID=UPI003FD12BD2
MPVLPILLLLLLSLARPSETCDFVNNEEDTKMKLRGLLDDDSVRLVEYNIEVDGYSREFWRTVGGNEWFQPWVWYRAKGTYSQRLLLLFHYFFGFLKPYLGIGVRSLHLHLNVSVPGCLDGMSSSTLEPKLRQFLYYDLKNETEKQATEFSTDIRVCSQHVGNFSGSGRLVYRCCSRDNQGLEACSEESDDEWVWVLRAFIITLCILLFLYFPRLIPRGYYVYTFHYYPPDGQTFNLLLTPQPARYRRESPDSTVLPAARWRKLRTLEREVSELQPDVVYSAKIKRVTFECGMDRLLSETSSPVSVFRSLFDTWIRCKVRHADSLEDCCSAPVCGELCCTCCPPWAAWLRALRTIVLLLVLAVPALPILYVMAADDLEYQEVATMMDERGLRQSYNFYFGSIFGKVVVSLLAGLYVLHVVLVVVDGCHDQNLARSYTELLQVARHRARLRDRLHDSQAIIRKVFWPIKRLGVMAVPLWLILLLLLPLVLLVYMVATAPVPKLLVHCVRLLAGRTAGRRRKTNAEMTVWGQVENMLFVFTLVDVFAVLTLALNFLVHVLVIAVVQLIVNVAFLMKFFTIMVLLVVYIRDSFRMVNSTYASHHATVLGYVLALEEEDLKEEADKDWREQENKIFKIVPSSSADSKGRAGPEEEAYRKKRLFTIKNDALRMRMRSLALFLDKDDIPYIPKKFLEHTTTIACPGSPGRLEEAYLRALGRFARTVVFLMLILLPLLAYASTYDISTNLQFFAILFTGTIPLVMRYFFMSPGAMKKVNTNTLRFKTQMDDKVESFMQTWAVEDVIVEKFGPPNQDDPQDKPVKTKPAPLTDDAGITQPASDPSHPFQPLSAPSNRSSKNTGQLNYMLPDPTQDEDNGDDLLPNMNGDHAAMEPDDNTDPYRQQQRAHKHKKHKKKKKSSHRHVSPLDDLVPTTIGGGGGGDIPTNDRATVNGKEARMREKRRGKKEGPVRIDLILDISEEKPVPRGLLPGEGEGEEKSVGMSDPPSFHDWHGRPRPVDETKESGKLVV